MKSFPCQIPDVVRAKALARAGDRAEPENSEPVTFPKTCRDRGLKAKLCDPSP